MNLVDLSSLLRIHDWYYEMSDDHRVWKAGVAAEIRLCEEARKVKDLPWEERKRIAKGAGMIYKLLGNPEVGHFYRKVFKEFMSEEEMDALAKE